MDALWNAQFALAPAFALALLHSLWQVALLAVAAALALHLLAGRSAALRHNVGMGFLLAMLGVPVLGFIRLWLRPAAELNGGFLSVVSAPIASGAPGEFVQQSSWLPGLLSLCWLLGVSLMLLRQFGGWRLLGALDRHPYLALPAAWQRRVGILQGALGITRTVLVRLGDDVLAPFTARFLRPVIWLPLSLLTRLPTDQVEALLAHELAHVARLDWLWNGLQCVIESLLFFHPGVWWLGRRIRQEREHACDDLAVAACGDAIALAEALAALERHRHPLPHLLLSAHGGSMMNRISRLLSAPPKPVRWWAPLLLLLVLASGTLLAVQVDVSQQAPGLRVVSSTDGTMRAGDYREFTATGMGKQRYYRATVDAQGGITEVYKVDGKPAAIDADARGWITRASNLSVPPPPPPAPPAAPALPAPPAPPLLSESSEFAGVLRLVTADAAVAKKIGSPVAVLSETVHGNLRMDGRDHQDGSARLSFVLSGPKGRALVQVVAERDDGVWTLLTLQLKGEEG